MFAPPLSICALHTSPRLQVPFFAWSPDIRHHARRKYQPPDRLPEEHGDRPGGTSGGRAPREAGSARSEGSRRSGRSAGAGSEASTGAGLAAREVVVPMASRDDLGEAHTEPPLDRVTLAPRQPDPAWRQKVPPGPNGRQRHLSAVWDMVLESRGVPDTLRISFPCLIVVTGGSNLPEGQELVGLFAYKLVSGYWRVETGVSRIGEQGTVTTARVFGLNVVTWWDKRRREWVDVAWLAMSVYVGRQRKMGVADVIAVEGQDDPPTPSARKRKGRPPKGTPSPPSPPKAPRTATPVERAEPAAGRGQRGAVHKWVEQQLLLQRVGSWEARPISADAANRDLEARLFRANEDRQDAESRLADVTKEQDRLATKVKTLERDLATARKAKPPAQAAHVGEGPEGAEAPPGDTAGGGGGQCRRCPVPSGGRTGLACPGRGMRRPYFGGVHRPADGHDGQWPPGRCGQRGPRRP